MLVLSGCTNTDPITSESTGIWNHFFVYPFSWLILLVAKVTFGNFGLAIILVTIMIRILILPLMIKQVKSSVAMRALQPQMEKIRKKYKNPKDPAQAQKMQAETMALYQKNGVNPLSGCLPALIQMPILMAFYYAIRRTPEIASQQFLWFGLGAPDPSLVLPVLAGLITFLQTKVTPNPAMDQNPSMKMVFYIMPVMIITAGIGLPAVLPLYWVISGVFSVIQTYILYKVYQKPELAK
nr:membrane protein insertase YidC [Brevibacillus daliensis]